MAPFARNNGRIIDMKNADMPAMPTSLNESDSQWAAAHTGGLTKREHFAGLVIQGLMNGRNFRGGYSDLAETAVECADALLKALED